MIERTREEEYLKHFERFGRGEENVYQTFALCHIADMLTSIASDIRAIRETNIREEESR